jgi:hypothetical protein
MARFTGTIVRSDLEGGLLQLEADDGATVYELEGDVDEQWVGKRVSVEGSVNKNVMSFTMTGPRLVVKAITAAK